MRDVPDRPGHDLRYALDASKIERGLGGAPDIAIEDGRGDAAARLLANEARRRPSRADRC